MYKLDPVWTFNRPIRQDEIFSSWLLRVARAHGAQLHTFCDISIGKQEIWTRDIDISAPSSFLQKCAKLSNESLEVVEETTLQQAVRRFHPDGKRASFTPWILNLGIYHRTRTSPGWQFCPDCWEEHDPYFRKSWRLAFMTHCDRHPETQLIDHCQHCDALIVPHRTPKLDFRLCHGCHRRVDGHSVSIDYDESDWMQEFLLALFRGDEYGRNFLEASNWFSTEISKTDFLADSFLLDLRILLIDLRLIKFAHKTRGQLTGITETQTGQLFEHSSNQQRRAFLKSLGKACYSGPESLLRWLSMRNVTQRQLSMLRYSSGMSLLLSRLPSGMVSPKSKRQDLMHKLHALRLKHADNFAAYRLNRSELFFKAMAS